MFLPGLQEAEVRTGGHHDSVILFLTLWAGFAELDGPGCCGITDARGDDVYNIPYHSLYILAHVTVMFAWTKARVKLQTCATARLATPGFIPFVTPYTS